MKLSAIVHPSRAPAWQRWIWYGTSAVLFFFGALMLNTFPIAPTLLALGAILWLIAPAVLLRSAYKAEIETAPGELRVRPRFGFPFRIRTAALVGASIAIANDVPFVSIASSDPWQTTFALQRGASTDEIRRVLGVPTGGFGVVRWRHAPSSLDYLATVGRIVCAVMVGTLLVAPDAMPSGSAFAAFGLLALIAMLVIVVALTKRHVLGMDGNGVSWTDGRGSTSLEYREIERVGDDGRALTILATGDRRFVVPCEPTRWVSTGLREGERRAMVAQLDDAVRRSKGRARVPEAITYASELARGSASASEWLTRLDAIAASGVGASSGYRGSTIPVEALWGILEDHDSEPVSRAASARILARMLGEKADSRIEEAIASTHDDSARALIRTVAGGDARTVFEEIEREARHAGELTK